MSSDCSSTRTKMAPPRSPKLDPLMASPSRRRAQRQQSANGGLKLPSLPRFHPANFASQQSSAANTPSSGINSPQPPMSPRTQNKQYSEAQKQLYAYQREIISNVARNTRTASGTKPTSPKLMPLAGSPGPVTPLELEGHDAGGYLMAGHHGSSAAAQATTQAEYVEKLIREEAARLDGLSSPSRSTHVGRF